MKTNVARNIRVGLFVVMTFAASALVIFFLGDIQSLFKSSYSLKARFQDVSGLGKGSTVYLGGLKVGKVSGLEFTKPENGKAPRLLVRFEINTDYQALIRKDSEVTITTEGLLGDKGVFITAGTDGHEMLKDGDELKVLEKASLEEMLAQGSDALNELKSASTKVNEILDGIKNQEGIVGQLIYDKDSKKILTEMKNIVSSFQGIVNDVKKGRGLLYTLVYDPQAARLGKQLNATVDNFADMSVNLKEISRKVEEGEGSVGALVNDPTVYNDLMTLMGGANRNKLLRFVVRSALKSKEKDTIEK